LDEEIKIKSYYDFIKLPQRSYGINLAKGLPAFGGTVGDQGSPRFKSGAKIPTQF